MSQFLNRLQGKANKTCKPKKRAKSKPTQTPSLTSNLRQIPAQTPVYSDVELESRIQARTEAVNMQRQDELDNLKQSLNRQICKLEERENQLGNQQYQLAELTAQVGAWINTSRQQIQGLMESSMHNINAVNQQVNGAIGGLKIIIREIPEMIQEEVNKLDLSTVAQSAIEARYEDFMQSVMQGFEQKLQRIQDLAEKMENLNTAMQQKNYVNQPKNSTKKSHTPVSQTIQVQVARPSGSPNPSDTEETPFPHLNLPYDSGLPYDIDGLSQAPHAGIIPGGAPEHLADNGHGVAVLANQKSDTQRSVKAPSQEDIDGFVPLERNWFKGPENLTLHASRKRGTQEHQIIGHLKKSFLRYPDLVQSLIKELSLVLKNNGSYKNDPNLTHLLSAEGLEDLFESMKEKPQEWLETLKKEFLT